MRTFKKFTADDNILAAADRVAFTKNDITDLLNSGVKEIYLCGEHFTLPANIPDITYIGVNMPTVEFEGDSVESGIDLKDVEFNIEKYLYDDVFDFDNADKSLEKFFTFFDANFKLGMKLLETDSAKAQFVLGLCYAEDLTNVEDEDEIEEEALKWFCKSAEQGHADEQYELYDCYWNGNGVEENEEEAIKWLRMAAEQGDKWAQEELEELLGGSHNGKET